ncbi:MAG: hypothetical protein ACRYGG_16550 [Janthinobacterium lividum]
MSTACLTQILPGVHVSIQLIRRLSDIVRLNIKNATRMYGGATVPSSDSMSGRLRVADGLLR